MSKFIAEIKFQASYYYKNVAAYLADVVNALLGRTRRQAKFLEELVDHSMSAMTRIAAENAKLQNRLDVISKNTIKVEALKKIAAEKPSKKKASPKQGQ
jgi:regulator of replication initiation timing